MSKRLMALAALAVFAAILGGCGYKAPPYYEKPSPKEGPSVAL
ncbi:MAG: hypothetical protein AB1763_01780 [Campylobacterota bacterium]